VAAGAHPADADAAGLARRVPVLALVGRHDKSIRSDIANAVGLLLWNLEVKAGLPGRSMLRTGRSRAGTRGRRGSG
jgi:hypothetical protein